MLDRLNMESIELSRTVTLPDGQTVRLRAVVYTDSANHYVTLHLKSGEGILSRTPLAEIESLLCAYPFFYSPMKGIVINFHEVTSKTDDVFVLSDGTRIPISRRKAKEVADAYSAFRFSIPVTNILVVVMSVI